MLFTNRYLTEVSAMNVPKPFRKFHRGIQLNFARGSYRILSLLSTRYHMHNLNIVLFEEGDPPTCPFLVSSFSIVIFVDIAIPPRRMAFMGFASLHICLLWGVDYQRS